MEVKVKELYKSFDKLQVVADLSFNLFSDKIHCFFGPSGCGKTTLVNLLAGVTKADGGQIEGLVGKTFSYVFQEDRLLPWATLEENLHFVLEGRCDKAEARHLIDKYLDLVELSKFRNNYPDELSGGMKQRVSIARAFAYEADVLIMDEPFKGLHLELKKGFMDFIKEYWRGRRPLTIFITHDIEEALYLADDIYIFDGPPLEMKNCISIDVPLKEREIKKEEMEHYRQLLVKR